MIDPESAIWPEGGLPTDVGLDLADAMIELLAATHRETCGAAPISPPIQIEFGIAALDEIIDTGGGGGQDDADALAALTAPEMTSAIDVPVGDASCGNGASATHGHLAIKIVFGDDNPGSGTLI